MVDELPDTVTEIVTSFVALQGRLYPEKKSREVSYRTQVEGDGCVRVEVTAPTVWRAGNGPHLMLHSDRTEVKAVTVLVPSACPPCLLARGRTS